MTNFGISSILVRAFLSFGVLFAIYNSSGYSYFHWIVSGFGESSAGEGFVLLMIKLSVGLFLLVVVLTFTSIVYHAVGIAGIALLLLLTAPVTTAFGYYFIDTWGFATVLFTGGGIFFTMGLVYSNLRYRLSGQVQPASNNSPRAQL